MAWYRTGSITATSGNPTIIGAGTAWAANIQSGDAFKGPDESLYEVQSVNSDASITLASNYAGATAAGAVYAIIPTQGRVRDLAAQVLPLINDFGAVVTGAGAGKFEDGTAAAPGVSFAADPDCGFYRDGPNSLGVSVGGVLRLGFTSDGLVAAGGMPNAALFSSFAAGLQAATTSAAAGLAAYQADGTKNMRIGMFSDAASSTVGWDTSWSTGLSGYVWKHANAVKMTLDVSGNLGVNSLNPGGLGKFVVGDTNGTLFWTAPTPGFGDLGMTGCPGNFMRIGPSGYADGGVALMFTNGAGVRTEGARIDAGGNWIQTAPAAPPALTAANQLVLNMTSNTNVRISGRGSDGVTRVGNITLA